MVATEAAVIAEEVARLSIELSRVQMQFATEKARMAGISMEIGTIVSQVQQLGVGIQLATEGSNVGYRESKIALDKTTAELTRAASMLIGF